MLTYPCWDQSWSMLVTGPLLSFWQLSMQRVMKFSPKWPHFRFSVHYRTVMICLAEQTQTTSKQWNKNSTPSDKHYQQSAVRYDGVTGVHLICIVWMRPYAYKLVCICISWSRIAISLTDDDLSRHLFAFFAFTIRTTVAKFKFSIYWCYQWIKNIPYNVTRACYPRFCPLKTISSPPQRWISISL